MLAPAWGIRRRGLKLCSEKRVDIYLVNTKSGWGGGWLRGALGSPLRGPLVAPGWPRGVLGRSCGAPGGPRGDSVSTRFSVNAGRYPRLWKFSEMELLLGWSLGRPGGSLGLSGAPGVVRRSPAGLRWASVGSPGCLQGALLAFW